MSGVILFLIVGFLIMESLPILQGVGGHSFLQGPSWHPTSGNFNLTPMLVGTLLVTLGAVVIAAPFGILSAVFIQYYAPRAIAVFYRRLIEVLAGIPSVVYGFWGLVVLVPLIVKVHPPGPSLLAGILILGLMILPTIALVAESSFVNLPADYVQSASALGLSRWSIVRGVCLPAARPGLLTALLLGVGRAIGETMAVLMVCGNIVAVPDSLFAPVRTLTANIALEMAYATGDHRSALFVSGLALMLMILVVVGGVNILTTSPTIGGRYG